MRIVFGSSLLVFALQGCVAGDAAMAYKGRLPDTYVRQYICTASLSELSGHVIAIREVDSDGFILDGVASGRKRQLVVSYNCYDKQGVEAIRGEKMVESRTFADGILDVGELK